jgi:hypothetical protein
LRPFHWSNAFGEVRRSDHPIGKALVRNLAGCGGVLLSLIGKLTLRPKPLVFRIADATLTLPDLVSPLSDSLILA